MHEAGETELPTILLAIAMAIVVSWGVLRYGKLVSERKAGIQKLQRLVAEETARAEAEAQVEYASMFATDKLFPTSITSIVDSCSPFSVVNSFHTTNTYPAEEEEEEEEEERESIQASIDNKKISDASVACFVCSAPTTLRCSRCKAVKYCTRKCQEQHWEQEHKLVCRDVKEVPQGNGRSIVTGSEGSGSLNEYHLKKERKLATSARQSQGLAYATFDGNLPRPNMILFPYDYFMKLFNWNKLRFPPCGLINRGNSCFANVVLQCLTCTRPLAAYLLKGDHSQNCQRNDWCFMCELQHHILRVKESEGPFAPIGILSQIPKIGNHLGYGRQEDAHEFMRFAIDSMQSICLDEFGGEKAVDPCSQETTLIQHIFGGYLQSQVKCMQCHHESKRYENMMDLTVEIHGNVESLEDALAQFTSPEWLDGENKYKCDKCSAYVKAWKCLTVHEAPNILTIALKRFQSGRYGKLNKEVTFPELLDISPYISGKGNDMPYYQLYAVVVHVDSMNASFYGHYVCYVKDFRGSWYRVDDSKVKEVNLDKVLEQKAYMLLYARRSPRPAPITSADRGDLCGYNDNGISVNDSTSPESSLSRKYYYNRRDSCLPRMVSSSSLEDGLAHLDTQSSSTTTQSLLSSFVKESHLNGTDHRHRKCLDDARKEGFVD